MTIQGLGSQTPDIDATIVETQVNSAVAQQIQDAQQVQAEKSEASLANEEQTPLGQNAKTTRLEKKRKT